MLPEVLRMASSASLRTDELRLIRKRSRRKADDLALDLTRRQQKER